jgi:hypothetical protein
MMKWILNLKKMRIILLFFLIVTICIFGLSSCYNKSAKYHEETILKSSSIKCHEEIISKSSQKYTVQMRGKIDGEMTRDPVGYWAFDQYWEPNVYVEIENIGDNPVINPWLRRTDKPDTRTLKTIVDYVIRPGMSDSEKARALFEFERRNRFHATTQDEEVDDAIKRFNCYGYTLCGNESKIISDLWRTAGLKVRKGHPTGHSTAEVYYDDNWHLLDTDEHILCLLRDNKTAASETQIVDDHDLMKRIHTYGVLSPHNRFTDEGSVSLHYYEGKRDGEQPGLTKHSMNFILRPHESIIWKWNPANLFHGNESGNRNQRWRLTDHVMNGSMEYSPDLLDPATDKYIETSNIVRKVDGPLGPGLYADKGTGIIIVPISSAYPIVGGQLIVRFGLGERNAEDLETSISFDKGATWREVYTESGFDYTRMSLDLNGIFHVKYLDPASKEGYDGLPYEDARYEYLLRFRLISKAENPTACLKSFCVKSTLQMAQLALPGLSLGKNEFIYTDESPEPAKVKITHSWKECNTAEVPGKPAGAIYPSAGNTVNGSQFTLKWKPPAGNTFIDDYEFQLSEYKDMRWELSPNFHRLINRTPQRNTESFTIPYKGLLNPDQPYYWRVRARSWQGIWGPWSEIYSFNIKCPAVPIESQASFDNASRTATLSWKSGKNGTPPACFKIYGSKERGFTASDTAYKYNAGIEGIQPSLSNLLYKTEGPVTTWTIPSKYLHPYYRVVAVDANGTESGPSTLAELEHPLIITDSLQTAIANRKYDAQIMSSYSIGHLVSATQDGKPIREQFLSADDLFTEVSGLPNGIRVDPITGIISGTPSTNATGNYVIKVTVKSKNSGKKDSMIYKLKVVSH